MDHKEPHTPHALMQGNSNAVGVRGNSLGGVGPTGGGLGANQPPIIANGLSHLEKLNMRLRARNSNAHQNNSMAGATANGANLPLSQRSFSPP